MNRITSRDQSLALLAALTANQPATGSHSQRVALMARSLGFQLGLTIDAQFDLLTGALLHDIGKLTTSRDVLEKPGPLDPRERTHMQEHAVQGALLLSRLNFPAEIMCIAEQHHERWEGNGYPYRRSGEQIALGARICAVADSYDAITSERAHSRARSHKEACAEILNGSGTQFDPQVVAAFSRLSFTHPTYQEVPAFCLSPFYPPASIISAINHSAI